MFFRVRRSAVQRDDGENLHTLDHRTHLRSGLGAGYLGGIFLLLLVYVGFIGGDSHWFGIIDDDAMNIRVVALFAACWFLIFALPVVIVMSTRKGGTGPQDRQAERVGLVNHG